MALKTARSTVEQREALANTFEGLRDALQSQPSRYWLLRSQRDAYSIVLEHLESWIRWESDK